MSRFCLEFTDMFNDSKANSEFLSILENIENLVRQYATHSTQLPKLERQNAMVGLSQSNPGTLKPSQTE